MNYIEKEEIGYRTKKMINNTNVDEECLHYSDDDYVFVSDDEYSDKIDSDVEAELYGVIHHQESLPVSQNSPLSEHNISEVSESNSNIHYKFLESSVVTTPKLSGNNKGHDKALSDQFYLDLNSNNVLYNSSEISAEHQLKASMENVNTIKYGQYDHNKNVKRKSELISNEEVTTVQSVNGYTTQCNTYSPNKKIAQCEQRPSNHSILPKKYNPKSNESPASSLITNYIKQSRNRRQNEHAGKKIIRNTLPPKLNFKLNSTINVDFSDSDSSVLTESGEPSEPIDLQTNLLSDAVFKGANCSFTSRVFSTPYSADKRNTSLPNITLEDNLTDPWHINNEDLHRIKKYSGRYHEKAILKCTNCKQMGHTAKFCSMAKDIKCFICGGNHVATRCKKKICSKCYRLGHDSNRCWMQGISTCILCNMKGHTSQQCPDIWRRYHLTTKSLNIVKGKRQKQDTPLYCCNCGQIGHFGAKCRKAGKYFGCFPTWPSVISYEDPVGNEDFLKRPYQYSMQSFNQITQNITESRNNKNIKKKKKKNLQQSMVSVQNKNMFNENMPVTEPPSFPRTPKSLQFGVKYPMEYSEIKKFQRNKGEGYNEIREKVLQKRLRRKLARKIKKKLNQQKRTNIIEQNCLYVQ